jgi:hypothetical protein
VRIHIIKIPDVYLTATELTRYRGQYRQEFSHYCGTPPDFEEWVAEQESQKRNARAQKIRPAGEV